MPNRTDQATVKRFAVYVKTVSNGTKKYIQKPYDVVSYNWNDGTGEVTYIQPNGFRVASRTVEAPVYDDIRFYDSNPTWDPFPNLA